jgi:hypothetical protein
MQEAAAVRQTCKQYIPRKASAAALELGYHLLPCQGLICSYFLSIMADRELQHTFSASASSKLQTVKTVTTFLFGVTRYS